MAEPFRLTAEDQQKLRAITPEIAAIRKTIESLQKIGIPVDEYVERLETAERIRAGLLQQFSSPITQR